MAIARSRRPVASRRIETTARDLLDASTLCAIATVSPQGGAHVNTAYFAWTHGFDMVWLSDPGAAHSRNLGTHRSAAIAVYDSNQVWGKPDRGIQLFGSARRVTGKLAREAEGTYAKRFPDYRRIDLSDYDFYLFRPHRLKVFDEAALGSGVFVAAKVGVGGRVSWEHTDVYRSGDIRASLREPQPLRAGRIPRSSV